MFCEQGRDFLQAMCGQLTEFTHCDIYQFVHEDFINRIHTGFLQSLSDFAKLLVTYTVHVLCMKTSCVMYNRFVCLHIRMYVLVCPVMCDVQYVCMWVWCECTPVSVQ